MGNAIKKLFLAIFLGLLFGIFAVAGGVITARYTGLWEVWEKAGQGNAASQGNIVSQDSKASRDNNISSGSAGLYESPKAEIPDTGEGTIQKTIPVEGATAEEKKAAESIEKSTETAANEVQIPASPAQNAEKAERRAESNPSASVVYDVSQVAAKVMPAVVAITNHYVETSSFWGQTYSQEAEASGSGFIVGENNDEILLVTNYHVVESATKLTVIFFDEETAEAKIKGTARSMDLAVIAVPMSQLSESTIQKIAVATLGDSDSLVVGEPAVAIGNALGYGQSVTVGVISAVNRPIKGYENEDVGGGVGLFIQTDAAINPGNSGGALLNIRGEVIGINSNKLGGNSVEGMGYAIPISAAKPIIAELMQSETKNRVADQDKGFLGITGATVTDEAIQYYGLPRGVYITGIITSSGADFAGLREADVIISFDGHSVSTLEELQELLSFYPTGSIVEIEFMRQEGNAFTRYRVEVTLGERT